MDKREVSVLETAATALADVSFFIVSKGVSAFKRRRPLLCPTITKPYSSVACKKLVTGRHWKPMLQNQAPF
jgi:hypothetical protein